MVLRYIAHSCFQLILENGKRILFDPFSERVGYDMAGTEADIVLTSHAHYDHGCTEKVSGGTVLVNEPGDYKIDSVRIMGFSTFHDKENGTKRGKNTAFKVFAEGLNILHCGDIGHLMDDELLGRIGAVDVALVPVGGYYTIDATESAMLCMSLGAPVIIPMHYRTPSCTLPIASVSEFVEKVYATFECGFLDACEVELDKLPPGVYVLKNSFGE